VTHEDPARFASLLATPQPASAGLLELIALADPKATAASARYRPAASSPVPALTRPCGSYPPLRNPHPHTVHHHLPVIPGLVGLAWFTLAR